MEILLMHHKLIEIIGAVLSIVYLFFSIRKSLLLWPLGLLASAFYILVYYYSKLYAEMALQMYYIIVSIYGWYYWLYGKKNKENKPEISINRLNLRQTFWYAAAFIVLYLCMYFVLKYFTDSSIPGWDSLATALSLIATWMLAKKVLENWILWIVTDALCIGIYIYKDLYLTAILFVVYTILAFVGYFNWKNSKE